MALWNKITREGNVEYRRAAGPGAMLGGGLGVAGIAIVLLLNLLGGEDIDLTDILTQLANTQAPPAQNYDAKDFEGADSYEVFASKVLGSANDMWGKIFSQNNLVYQEPRLILFRGGTDSSCGGAYSQAGPHYCPTDQTIYLDETFFEELTQRFGAEGGDVAEAYVIAHEVGHHIQYQLGGLDQSGSAEGSIAVELQADCFAGLWAYSLKDLHIFEQGEIHEAINAAAAVGDDRIQSQTTGRIDSESWTHGSSADRVGAFNNGYESGQVAKCK